MIVAERKVIALKKAAVEPAPEEAASEPEPASEPEAAVEEEHEPLPIGEEDMEE